MLPLSLTGIFIFSIIYSSLNTFIYNVYSLFRFSFPTFYRWAGSQIEEDDLFGWDDDIDFHILFQLSLMPVY
jgi:hypothetical protein